MDIMDNKELKNIIVSGFLKYLESKPEVKNNPLIQEAYTKLKKEIENS
ncbi:MAG: hypothetical protein PHF84_08750 [bacterium]|nr:hypothetical protein [bacterium]